MTQVEFKNATSFLFMRFLNTSSMNSLRPSPSGSIDPGAVAALVEQRAGRDWCLFLDRDGVINTRIVDDYVRNTNQLEWLPGAREAIGLLRDWAPHLVVVTNQQGVGKGLMSSDDLDEIHRYLQSALPDDAIDEFLVCPHLRSDGCSCRKPEPGLVLDWLARHPETEPALSMIVGDSPGDMNLAHNVAARVHGCAGIRIGSHDAGEFPSVEASFDTLWDFALSVQRAMEKSVQ